MLLISLSISYFIFRGSAAGSNALLSQVGPCGVDYTGQVNCAWRTFYQASCNLDYTNWPFDTQFCQIRIALWSHKAEEVNITHDRKVRDLYRTALNNKTVHIKC